MGEGDEGAGKRLSQSVILCESRESRKTLAKHGPPLCSEGDDSKGEGLMAYDLESNCWSHLKPTGTAPLPANTNAAFYEYDARLDIVVAIHFKGKSHGIFVYMYNPKTNSWADPIPFAVDGPKFQFAANTFFDRELNAYFCHVAGDSKDDGVMWVYRYKK